DVIVAGVRLEVAHHGRDLGIGNPAVPAARRHIMIGDAKGELWLCDTPSASFHLAKSVKRALMDVMPINPEEAGSVVAPHNFMRGPELVDQGLGIAHGPIGLL